MKREMIKIDKDRCDGCGLCVDACAEGALALIDGKAELIREDYCDGLGNCLPHCPQNAITIEVREAPAFKKEEAEAQMHTKRTLPKKPKKEETLACGCPSHSVRSLKKKEAPACHCADAPKGMLSQWPVQIKLLPTEAPFYQGSPLLIAADCTAYAYSRFHEDFIKGRITLVGCPKLDSVDYSEKLTEIFARNDIKDITLTRMEVPCCGGMEKMVKTAIAQSGKDLSLTVVTISAEGEILKTQRF